MMFSGPCDCKEVDNKKINGKKIGKTCTFCQKKAKIRDVETIPLPLETMQ